MDFFQGNSPPNFIFFCLDNQNVNETRTSFNPVLEIPTEPLQNQSSTGSALPDTPTETGSGRPNVAAFEASPGSIDSQTDVNVYAELMVRRLESSQSSELRAAPVQVFKGLDGTSEPREQRESTPRPSPNLANNPFQPSEGISLDSSLTQLESTLRVATTSRTQLPELLSTHDLSREHFDPSNLQSNEDNSSIYEVPALPSGEARVRFLTDLSENRENC